MSSFTWDQTSFIQFTLLMQNTFIMAFTEQMGEETMKTAEKDKQPLDDCGALSALQRFC